MSDHLWQICNVACIVGVDIVVVICSFCMYMDVHYSSMLCSLVDSRVRWYVECDGWMSGDVSCVE
jgi:hypothetical protein